MLTSPVAASLIRDTTDREDIRALADDYIEARQHIARLEADQALAVTSIEAMTVKLTALAEWIEVGAPPMLHPEVSRDLSNWLKEDRWQVGSLEFDDVAIEDGVIITIYATVVTAQGRSPFVMGVV